MAISTSASLKDFSSIPMLPILDAKPKKRTKKCGTCGVHAPSNKSTFCKNCPGQVRNWVKPVKKKKTGQGKVCPVEGCGWSTRGNRTHFCGKCGAAFAARGKRKAYNKSGMPAKKKQKKRKQEPTSVLSQFDDIDFILSSTPPMLSRESSLELIDTKKEPVDENWSNLISEDDLLAEITPDFFDHISTEMVEEVGKNVSVVTSNVCV